MKKGKVSLPLLLGLALILCSVGLLLFFRLRMDAGAQNCRQVVANMQELLPQRTAGTPGLYPDLAMPVLQIDGVDYVALLEIPQLGIALPVAAGWDGENLSDAPRRFSGSSYDHSLVIGGADHAGQFAFCDQIGHDTCVMVTDMTGAQFVYEVARIDRAAHADSAWLTGDDWDLTLFCHDLYTMEYIAVRCRFAYA